MTLVLDKINSLKHIFTSKKQTFLFLYHKNLWAEFSANLVRMLFTLSTLENFVPCRNPWYAEWKSENQRGLDLDSKEDVSCSSFAKWERHGWDKWTLFCVCSINILGIQQLTLEKARSSCTILYADPTEKNISCCSEISSVVTLLTAKMKALTESTISGVLVIVDMS